MVYKREECINGGSVKEDEKYETALVCQGTSTQHAKREDWTTLSTFHVILLPKTTAFISTTAVI